MQTILALAHVVSRKLSISLTIFLYNLNVVNIFQK